MTIVTLNRAARKNCMTLAMWHELARLFRELAEDSESRAIILTGSGGNFCTGADISEFGVVRSTAEQITTYSKAVDGASHAIMDAPQPVIAAIQGYCVGGGCGLAMACDFRFAAPESTFFIPAARLSIIYSLRETQNLLALVGLSNAKRILYSAERIKSAEAAHIGLIDRIENDPLAASLEFSAQIARNAPLSVSGTKKILNKLATGLGELDLEEAQQLMKNASQSEDYREGRLAFKEKREPRFKGR
ncbi:MAG: enoyl-CoA hydratase-related protein [Ardenticatenaceae bacterium]